MITIILEHASDALKGELTKWITVVKPGVYVGNINARTRELLISKIQNEYDDLKEIAAQIYFDSKNELGYEVVEIGMPTKKLVDFQGLKFVSSVDHTDELGELSNLCWAKLEPYKSLYRHMYETGCVAKVFLEKTIYSSLLNQFKNFFICDMTDEELIDTISFFVALHDIGKAWPDFQLKANDNHEYHIERELELLNCKKMIDEHENRFIVSDKFRHELSSSIIIERFLSSKNINKDTIKCVRVIYENHHLVVAERDKEDIANCFEKLNSKEDWITIQNRLIERIEKEFKPCYSFNLSKNKYGPFIALLLGFLYRCDWIASSLFEETCKSYESVEDYKKHVQEILEGYIKELGISIEIKPKENLSLKEVFPLLSLYQLRPLQSKAEELSNKHPDFDCTVIEDLTGSGKTEAGFYLAYKAMLARGKKGIYFGLPTNATEQAMNPRIQTAIDSIYGNNVYSVSHASSKSWIYQELTNSEDESERQYYASQKETKLMMPFATGTVDQIEMSVLRRKYMLISLMDFVDKVVVIDEMHAYDAYMQGVLKVALQWLKCFDVPVVIMSATLPNSIKKTIHEVYCKQSYKSSDSYPLITQYFNNEKNEFSLEACEKRKYNIHLNELVFGKENDNLHSEICHIIEEKIRLGGNCVCIMNTVSSAKKMYKEITVKFPNIESYLIQGRNTLENKEKIANLLLDKYGKEGKKKGNRPEKSIVIATQIIEQSIDLDFDFMITELAPIDLLLQRFGRWHRHDDKGTIREKNSNDSPIEILYSSDLSQHIVYKDRITLLEATLSYLKKHNVLFIPEQSREMVEFVYSSEESEKEIRLEVAKTAKSQLNTINKPSTFPVTPWDSVKNLSIKVDTRLETFPTYEVCIVSSERYEEIIQGVKVDKNEAADLKYRHTISVSKNEINELTTKYDGKGWLDKVIIIPDNIGYSIDEQLGFQYEHESNQ